MELGFHVPIFDIDGGVTAIAGELARVGTAAEESGATWLSFMDHFFQIEPTGLPAESNMLEGYTTLGYLAAHTSKIDLGLLVTGVTYRIRDKREHGFKIRYGKRDSVILGATRTILDDLCRSALAHMPIDSRSAH
jgi:hypothetical protein